MHSVVSTTAAIATKDATCACEEANDESDDSTEDEPVSVTEVGMDTTTTDVITSDTEYDHFDDPCDNRSEECEGSHKSHEDCTRTVIGKTAQAKQESDSRETRGDGDKDKCSGEAVEETTVEAAVSVLWWEKPSDVCL